MYQSILAAAALVFAVNTPAQAESNELFSWVKDFAHSMTVNAVDLDWKVGDSTDYKIAGGIINGKMHVVFREKTEEGFWVQQDMDLGFLGQQKVEVLYERATGKVLKLIVNGQEQTPPDGSDLEIIETRKESVTVPKGTFEALYAKIHSKSENTDSEIWINPNVVSLGGMLKSVQPSQMGVVTVELTDFRRQ